jgi:frataxin-like iron-binding protein CyaY
MSKTLSITLEMPRFIKNFKARRNAKKQISKMQHEEILAIFSKSQKVDSASFEAKSENTTDDLKSKMQKLDNRIIASPNNRNSNLHLDKGRIDEVIEMLKQTPTKDLVISTKAGKTRVFLNNPNPLKISRVRKFLKNHGDYEFEVKNL